MLVDQYQIFLFDFDGLLVNTEKLHFLAYQRMCARRGFTLDWDLADYFKHALTCKPSIEETLYNYLPALQKQEGRWSILYEEKKRMYDAVVEEGEIELMRGVEKFLSQLARKDVKKCVVTHSPLHQVARIRARHPILNTIEHWITRENYSKPKPDPECYVKAIDFLKSGNERVVGFEDSPRGLKALLGSSAEAIFVSAYFSTDQIEEKRAFTHVSSFEEIIL